MLNNNVLVMPHLKKMLLFYCNLMITVTIFIVMPHLIKMLLFYYNVILTVTIFSNATPDKDVIVLL